MSAAVAVCSGMRQSVGSAGVRGVTKRGAVFARPFRTGKPLLLSAR
jgi:hypothetical protein